MFKTLMLFAMVFSLVACGGSANINDENTLEPEPLIDNGNPSYDENPTPQITPTPSFAPEPTPQNSPIPSNAPTPTNAPAPTNLPEPNLTPTPPAGPTPIISPAPEPTPVPTFSPTPSDEPEITPPPSLPPFDLSLGEQWYTSGELRCNACHGDNGRSDNFPDLIGEAFLENYDFDSLMLKVLFMSEQHGSQRCDGNEPSTCAYEVAAYIWVDFNGLPLDTPPALDDEIVSACSINKNSGMRRLTATEIQFAIEDTFGVSASALNDLPRERNIGGFESIGSVQNSGSSFVLPLLTASISVANTIVNSTEFAHSCNNNQLEDCITETLRPYAEKLAGHNNIDDLLDRVTTLAITTAENQAPGISPIVPSADQCDTTAQCQAIFGDAADDCADSRSDQSFCSCGGERCDSLLPGFDDNSHIDAGLEHAIAALIMSPEFLYVRTRGSDEARVLNSYEVAKTLARTLWLSVPDAPLLTAVNNNQLSTVPQISDQIDRMMNDDKFVRFKQQFFNQWLGFDNVANYDIDNDALSISNWDAVAADMTAESLAFMNYLLDNNRSVKEILTADYSFLNERLANHYGIPGVSGDNLQKVNLPTDSGRQGLLTQGAILTRGANGDHASVVIRGETILSGLNCAPPASPDDSIQEAVDELANADLSEFEKMAERAEKPACAACHTTLDAIGWAFTGFDAAARPLIDDIDGHINDGLIDPRGIYRGDFYEGPLDLINLLTEQNSIEMCLSEKFMMYTLGRPVTYISNSEDNCIIEEILTQAREALPTGESDIKVKDLIKAVLTHDVSRVQGNQL